MIVPHNPFSMSLQTSARAEIRKDDDQEEKHDPLALKKICAGQPNSRSAAPSEVLK